ncbi:MAG: lipopolysaccharide heptosyltransferase II [Pyrinomonadaceae bacterium]
MKIAVRGTNWIGDAVMSVPALRALRRSFPDAKIDLLTPAWAKDVFEDSALFDNIITLENSWFERVNTWRRGTYDYAILFTNSFRSALTARSGGAKRIFGYKNEARGFLLSNAIKKPGWKNERHEIFYYLNLVAEFERKVLGKTQIIETPPDFSLSVSEAQRAEARKLLQLNKIKPGTKLIALGAGSHNSRAKRWGAEKFARFADLAASVYNSRAILLGAPDEKQVSEAVCAAANSEVVDFTGKTTLAEAIALLAESSVMVSNDMGLAHLAAAISTPTFTIFGPTNPKTTAPFNGTVIKAENIECAPCMLRECPIDHRCMNEIKPEFVIEAIRKHLI